MNNAIKNFLKRTPNLENRQGLPFYFPKETKNPSRGEGRTKGRDGWKRNQR